MNEDQRERVESEGKKLLDACDFGAVIEHYDINIKIIKNVNNDDEELDIIAKWLNQVAVGHLLLRNYKDAEQTCKDSMAESEKITEEASKLRQIAVSMHVLGNVYRGIGEIKKAIKHFTKSIKMIEKIKSPESDSENSDKGQIAVTLDAIGMCYLRKEDLKNAIKYFRKASNILLTSDDKDNVSEAKHFRLLGIYHSKMGSYNLALEEFKKSSKLLEDPTLENSEEAAKLESAIGQCHFNRKEYEEAKIHFEKSYGILKSVYGIKVSDSKKIEVAIIQVAIAKTCAKLGKHNEALVLEQLKKTFNGEIGGHDDCSGSLEEAECFHQLGVVYLINNNLDEAKETFEDAIKKLKSVGEFGKNEILAELHTNIGLVHTKRGQHEEAIYFYLKGITYIRNCDSKVLQQRVSSRNKQYLGDAHRDIKDFPTAVFFYEQSLTLFGQLEQLPEDKSDDIYNIAAALDVIGMDYMKNDSFERANKYFKLAGNIFSAKNARVKSRAEHFRLLGIYYSKLEEQKIALENLNECRKMLKDLKLEDGEEDAKFQTSFGHYYFNIEDYVEALKQFRKAKFFYETNSKPKFELEDAANRVAIAKTLNKTGDHPEALKELKSAVKILQDEEGDDRRLIETECWHQRGIVYYNQQKLLKAKMTLEETIKLADQCKGKDKVLAELHTDLGLVDAKMGKHHEAINSFLMSNKVIRNYGSSVKQRIIATNNRYLGDAHMEIKDYPTALLFYEKSLLPDDKSQDIYKIAEVQDAIGMDYMKTDNFERANKYFKLAGNIFTKHNARVKSRAEHFRLLGIYYSKLEEQKLALENLNKCREMLKDLKLEDGEDGAKLQTSFGHYYLHIEEYEEALEQFGKAISYYKKKTPESKLEVATNQVTVAEILNKTGKYKQAKEKLKFAMEIFQNEVSEDGRLIEAECWHQKGIVYYNQNKLFKAKMTFEETIKLANQCKGKDVLLAKLYTDLGLAVAKMGQHQEAINSFLRSNKVIRNYGSRATEKKIIATNKRYIGDVHKDIKDFATALFFYEQSLTLFEQVPEYKSKVTDKALCLQGLGLTFYEQEQFEKSEQSYQACQILIESHYGENVPNQYVAACLRWLGNVRFKQDRKNEAEELYERCLKMMKELKADPKDIAMVKDNLTFLNLTTFDIQKILKIQKLHKDDTKYVNIKGDINKTLKKER